MDALGRAGSEAVGRSLSMEVRDRDSELAAREGTGSRGLGLGICEVKKTREPGDVSQATSETKHETLVRQGVPHQ